MYWDVLEFVFTVNSGFTKSGGTLTSRLYMIP